MGPHAIRLMASACVPGAGPECTAIKSVFLTAMDRIVPKSAVAVTVGVAIIFLVNAIAPPVIQAHCEFHISLFFWEFRKFIKILLFKLEISIYAFCIFFERFPKRIIVPKRFLF